ncbi:hypothetical protein AgCh_005832 [Apium graveolens]
MANKKLIMILESDLKVKQNEIVEDKEMIKLLERYMRNPEANLPKIPINKNDLDDDEQKKDDQKPSGSNPSQSSKAAGSKDKKEEKKYEDYFQQLAEKIVRVWVVTLRKVRIYYEDGSFTFLGSNLMDTFAPTEVKRVISLLKYKNTATIAWRSVLAEWLIVKEETRARNNAEY